MVETETEKRQEEELEDEEEAERDVEKGEVGTVKEKVIESNVNNDEQRDFHVSMLQRLNPTNPLRIVVNGSTRVATPSPAQPSLPRSTPTPQVSACLGLYRELEFLFFFIFT